VLLTCRALLALVVAGAWAVVGIPATTAHAGGTICVALVVDFGDLGGGVSTTCARVPDGSTGVDVLTKSHRVTFDPRYGEDFVCAIDGKPAGGCSSVDGTHDWVYYHRAPGARSWTFSSEGAGTYKPRNSSTEGWVYDDGTSPAPRPPDVAYDQICPRATPAPAPTWTATSAPAVAKAQPTSAAPTATTAVTTPSTTAPSTRGHHAPRAVVAVPTPPSTTPQPSSPASPGRVLTADHSPAGGPPTGLLAGVAAVVVLGAGAWWRGRRWRGTQP
jgi:hypothetical protein